MNNDDSLSSLLRRYRIDAGFSQGEVAQLLGYESPQFVSKWERGVAAPPARTLHKLARLYRVPPDRFYEALLDYAIQKTKENVRDQFYGRKKG